MATRILFGVGALLIAATIVEGAPPARSNRRPPTTQKPAPQQSTTPKSDAKPDVTPSTKPGNNTFAPPPLPPQPKREEDLSKTPVVEKTPAPEKVEQTPV